MNKWIVLITVCVFLVCFSAPPARADRKTMEGFLLGTGAVLLGTAIINNLNHQEKHAHYRHTHPAPPPPPVHCVPPRPAHGDQHGRKWHPRGGHWEISRIWVEPVYVTRWNPGHYNPRGEWVNGRHERFLAREGFFREEKVWVRH